MALVSSVTTATARALLKTGKDKLAIRGMIAGTSAILMLLVCFFVSLPTAVSLPGWAFAAFSIRFINSSLSEAAA